MTAYIKTARGAMQGVALKEEKRRLAQTLRYGPPSLRTAD
jgi:hypothetical protein